MKVDIYKKKQNFSSSNCSPALRIVPVSWVRLQTFKLTRLVYVGHSGIMQIPISERIFLDRFSSSKNK